MYCRISAANYVCMVVERIVFLMSEKEVYVEIVEIKTDEVVKRMGPMSVHKADKVEGGAIQKIDLDNFFIRQVDV